jgi:hypothetical protein
MPTSALDPIRPTNNFFRAAQLKVTAPTPGGHLVSLFRFLPSRARSCRCRAGPPSQSPLARGQTPTGGPT